MLWIYGGDGEEDGMTVHSCKPSVCRTDGERCGSERVRYTE